MRKIRGNTVTTPVKPVNTSKLPTITPADEGKALVVENGVLVFKTIEASASYPTYDGTVVIEKANSVLGLRRFNTNTPSVFTSITEGELFEFYSNNIIKMNDFTDGGVTINEFTPLFDLEGEEIIAFGYDGEIVDGLPFSDFAALIGTFNVLSTSNSTVDEWLLANTEGVSV